MSVFSRLVQISRPHGGSLIVGLLSTAVATVLDTAVVNALLAAMVALVAPGSLAGGGLTVPSAETTGPLAPLLLQWGRLQAWATQVIGGADTIGLLIFLAIVTVLVVLLKCALTGRAMYLLNNFANLVVRDLRQRLFVHLLRLSPAQFDRERTGAHLSRVTSDVLVLQASIGPDLAEVLQAPLSIITALFIMFAISWKLMLWVLVLTPIIAFIITVVGRQIRKLAIIMQEHLGDLNGLLNERLANIRVIQSFVREPYERALVAQANQSYYQQTMRAIFVTELLAPSIEFLAYGAMVVGIILGGLEVLRGDGSMSFQSFLLFMMMAQKAGSHFKKLSRLNQLRQQAEGAGTRIFDLIDTEPEIQDAPDARPLPPVQGYIALDDVTFTYPTGHAVLSQVSITAEPGEVIALVGPSGAGKTTLVNLLPRFYDLNAGSIRIDDVDIRTVTLASLRAQIGSVPQETVLFSGTIFENILYGRLEATREEVIAAARNANALEFIERLSDGFDTQVGERGTRLSGGQRQRIAIARALLKDPRILILDEATSALDTESEALVQQALDRLMANRTTFVIAHRLSTVQHATRIVVLEHGRVVEVGPHAELLTRNGLYRRLYDLQFRERKEAVGV